MARPLIVMNVGITGEGAERIALSTAYPQAVELAGGDPILLPLGHCDVDRALSLASGVLLVGGPDYPPEMYGETNAGLSIVMPKARSDADMTLATKALEHRKPILGICGGAQLINIACGGTLYQDLRTQRPGCLMHSSHDGVEPFHPVSIANGSVLHEWVGETYVRVNSFHHQAIKEPGRGVRPAAWAADGVIEAAEVYEGDELRAVAIQWHPERLIGQTAGIGIFRGFVDLARRCGGR
jgi:putative glutamine amidotransferase